MTNGIKTAAVMTLFIVGFEDTARDKTPFILQGNKRLTIARQFGYIMVREVVMNYGLSDRVREIAVERFVTPARNTGAGRITIAVRDLMNLLRPEGFPARNWPQICTAIQSGKFLRANGLAIERIEGPPSGQSSNLVIHYLVINRVENRSPQAGVELQTEEDTPEAWAHRVTSKLAGLLKEELAEYGGAEGFIRWVRSEDDEPASEDAA